MNNPFLHPTVQRLQNVPTGINKPIDTWVNQAAGVPDETARMLEELRAAYDLVARAKQAFPEPVQVGPTFVTKDAATKQYRAIVGTVCNYFSLAWSMGEPETNWTPTDVEALIPLLGLSGAIGVMKSSLAQVSQFEAYGDRTK